MQRLHRPKRCEKCSLQEVTISRFNVVVLSRTEPWDSVGEVISSFVGELTQRRRRRQRGREKSNRLDWQNNNFTSASRFFYISLPWLHDYNVNVPIFTFCREREHKTTTFFFFSWTFILSLLEFNYKKFANIWRIKRDGVSATKFEATRIQLNFRKRRRRCLLSCLLTILRLRSAKSRNLSPPPLQKKY